MALVSLRQVLDHAAEHDYGVSVEGELGCLGSLEAGEAGEEDGVGAEGKLTHEMMLTDPDQARDFVKLRLEAFGCAGHAPSIKPIPLEDMVKRYQ